MNALYPATYKIKKKDGGVSQISPKKVEEQETPKPGVDDEVMLLNKTSGDKVRLLNSSMPEWAYD